MWIKSANLHKMNLFPRELSSPVFDAFNLLKSNIHNVVPGDLMTHGTWWPPHFYIISISSLSLPFYFNRYFIVYRSGHKLIISEKLSLVIINAARFIYLSKSNCEFSNVPSFSKIYVKSYEFIGRNYHTKLPK